MSAAATEVVSAEAQVEAAGRAARKAAGELATLPTSIKNEALLAMSEALIDDSEEILEANQRDLAAAEGNGLSEALIDRLTLTHERLGGIAEGVRQIAGLPDPVGEVICGSKRPNGLVIQQIRVPLGVVGIIYESRPNVTVDTASLCLKAGNAVILRGGSEAFHSNLALTETLVAAGAEVGIPEGAIDLIRTTDRAAAQALMRLNECVDVLIPRGGPGLIQTVCRTATVPTIETGVGNCHTYIHGSANLQEAADIAFNAKVQRPGVCNSTETLLVDREIAAELFALLGPRLEAAGVELRADPAACALLPGATPATESDWGEEFLSLTLAVRLVEGLEEAIAHINTYGSRHTEAILTRDYYAQKRFVDAVDAAAVIVNASTRFTDGYEFGMGAEVGISTQKLHARGPMGLSALTTGKWVVYGEGQVRD